MEVRLELRTLQFSAMLITSISIFSQSNSNINRTDLIRRIHKLKMLFWKSMTFVQALTGLPCKFMPYKSFRLSGEKVSNHKVSLTWYGIQGRAAIKKIDLHSRQIIKPQLQTSKMNLKSQISKNSISVGTLSLCQEDFLEWKLSRGKKLTNS